MSDQTDANQAGPPPKRGEAAWKEAKDGVAERNERARKAGKQVREARERQDAVVRRAAEMRERADLGLNGEHGL